MCQPVSLFATPRFLKKLVLKDGKQRIALTPGPSGDVKLTVNNALANDTVLRIHPTENGNKFEVVGSTLQGVEFWDWDLNNAYSPNGYSPMGKPAQAIVTEYFKGAGALAAFDFRMMFSNHRYWEIAAKSCKNRAGH